MQISFPLSALLAFAWTLVADASSNDHESIEAHNQRHWFNMLKRTIDQLPGGYVHKSLGLVLPAPSGAARGIGIISDRDNDDIDNGVLVRVPLSYQMTRTLALDTLTPLVPPDKLQVIPLDDLDDAALLVLLLAHERGLGEESKFADYIKTLPTDDPGCGFWAGSNDGQYDRVPSIIPREDLAHGAQYASRVSNGLSKDYAPYLSQDGWPVEWKDQPSSALKWSLCVVSSRGTAANSIPGDSSSEAGTRLVPLADFANHDVHSGGFIEMVGNEHAAGQDNYVDARPGGLDTGSFVIRAAWRNGTAKTLREGDEVTTNYNLPGYGPVDWFLSLGFVPQELSISSGNGAKNEL